jgi:tellurite resistance protein
MATKADFTEDEWESLHKGVTGAGLLVSVGDRDFTDTFGEAGALAKKLQEAHEQSDSELVREVAGVHGSGFGFTASPQKVEAETLAALRSATATLAAKAPDDADAYRKLVLDVADAVAEAKGGVKEGETAAIEKIKGAVGAA